MVAGLAVAGCSSSSKSGSGTTTTAAPAKPHPKVTIVAKDFSFQVPATIPAGYVDVTLHNRGKEDHQAQFVKLGSMTLAALKAHAVKTDLTGLKPGTVFAGGPNVAPPGGSSTATVKLEPGTYAVMCF